MRDLSLSLKFTLRDWRAGELRLLIAALLVAVAAISSVGFFVDRMRSALSLQARQLLGADLVIASDRAIDDAFERRAAQAGLQVSRTVVFPSMAFAEGRPQLASVKAVASGYPLRGSVRVADRPNAPDAPAAAAPAAGEAWVDPQLLDALGAKPGDELHLGDARFRISKVVTLEPDRGAGFVNFAPRVMIAFDDLAATNLVQPASRVTWRLLVAGGQPAVAAFEQWAAERLERGQRIESLESGRPELRNTVERAERFLSLVALLSALIAAVAIALGARRFADRHLDGCAVVKAIGLPQPRLVRVLLLELLWVAIAGAAAGAFAGWVVHFALVQAVAPLVNIELPAPSWLPALQSAIAALVLLLGFGAWPFLRLAGVPPLRVLRREVGGAPASAWASVLVAAVAFAALLFWFAGDRRLAAIAVGGFAGGAVVFALVTLGAVRALEPLRHAASIARSAPLRLAFASWSRRRAMTVTQTVALSVGLMALLLLTVTRTDLVEGWRRASPPDAPNRFVINIQPDQREPVEQLLREAGVSAPELYPMIRGRLVEVNGEAVGPERYENERAQRLVDREFNLSYMDEPPAHNEIVSGKWFDPAAREVSAEEGIMSTLGLKLGDSVVFDVAGERVDARITSVRKLAWDSMKVNFFMILSPGALADRPQTLITAFHQPEGREPVERALVERFPNLTVFDTGNIVRQVQSLLDQVIGAVQFLFVLTLAAGLAVLWGALASSRDERVREAGLMRALGASRRQLASAQLIELALSGGLAGLLAAAGSIAVGWALAEQAFGFPFEPRWLVLPGGALGGALLALAAGWLTLRSVLQVPPLATLRNA